MGNSLGLGKRSAKVMKISGETFKLKTPVRAGSVLANHPDHVLLESEAVKHYGVRAKPLEPQQELKPKRLYFLVELPKYNINNMEGPRSMRRVRSGIQMSAKDRLESMMLARRSASDLSIMKPPSGGGGGGLTVRMRVRKVEMERLMAESKDEDEMAHKILALCMANGGGGAVAEEELSNNNNVYSKGLKSREWIWMMTTTTILRTKLTSIHIQIEIRNRASEKQYWTRRGWRRMPEMTRTKAKATAMTMAKATAKATSRVYDLQKYGFNTERGRRMPNNGESGSENDSEIDGENDGESGGEI